VAYNIDFDLRMQGIEGLQNSGSVEHIDKLLQDLLFEYYNLIDELSIVEYEYNGNILSLERELALNGFYTRFGKIIVEEEGYDEITFDNLRSFSSVESMFFITAHGTDAMKTNYSKLIELGQRLTNIINEKKKDNG
jgi:hypothetical protein